MESVREHFYTSLLDDDFLGLKREHIEIGADYKYVHRNPLWNLAGFFVYRVFMLPYAALYMKLKFHVKYVNRKALKPFKKTGYFLYGNHTNVPSDGYIPTMLTYPKWDYVVVTSENVALKGTKNLMMMLGALPLPTTLRGMRNFLGAMNKRLSQKAGIVIYPEAHVWPYCIFIRPFKDDSFAYPVQTKKPCFSFTVTYQKRKRSEKPKMTVYVDGPFYADSSLPEIEQRKQLRNQVYQKMCEESGHSDYEFVHYEKKPE